MSGRGPNRTMTIMSAEDTLEAKYMAEDASSNKFLVSNFTNYKMTDSRPVLEQYNELLSILGRFTQHKINMDESIQDNDKPKGNNVVSPSVVNMVEHNNSSRYNDNRGKRKHHDTKADPNKKPKVTCWKCRKPRHLKKDCKASNVRNKANKSGTKGSVDGSSNSLKGQNMFNKSLQVYYVTYVSEAYFVQDDDVVWWVDSGATVHVCKDRCWFKTYESLNDGSILYMENESTALVHGHGCVDLRFSSGKVVPLLNVLHVPNIRENLVSSSVLNNCGYKQVTESNKFVLSKHGLFIGFGYLSNHMFRLDIVFDNISSAFMSTSKLNNSIIWHARLGYVHFKRIQDMLKDGSIPAFDMDTKKCKTCMLTKITKKPFQNIKRETKVFELIHSDLCGLHATPSLGIKKYFLTFIDDASRFCYVYLLHSKDEALDKFKVFKSEVKLQQGYLIKRFRTDRGAEYMDVMYFQFVGMSRPVLGERGIECIFFRYDEHYKAFRFYVIEPNESVAINCIIESVAINSIIKSRDAIFDEIRFSSVPRPSQRSLVNETEDFGGSVVPKKVIDEVVQHPEPELRKSKRHRTPKDFGPEFQLYLIEGTRDEVSDQHSYCFNVEDDPKTFDKAMNSQVVSFWKEAINDEMYSIIGNNTWMLADLPLGCKPLGCKWIFKRKLKVDGTLEKFKARLAIQGFKQKSRIDYFNTYALVVHISTIRLLIVMASIHSLIIHQMDVKTTFLNGKLDEEVYMNQFGGFIMSGNENKVDLTKEFLSSRFSMKDIGEADVILGIRIKHESNEIAISQSYYIKKVLKKFNYFDCTPVSTPMDTSEKLMPNNGQTISQLEYSKVIGYLMYAITCTRPDIAFVMGKLSWYTSNPGIQHWQSFQRVLKYLKKIMDYRLMYTSYPSVLEGYTDASWIRNTEDNLSTNGWVFLLGSALAATGKEAEYLKNLILEIPLWVKPMAPISIRYDSAATLEKAYSHMYNKKSRNLGVRHSMIRELITNRVVSIEFMRSKQNLADHLTKGLARDLVIKSAELMRLKSN
ncbi:zinc finger, CCHC-type containing protein [Tanacetum coccineum]